MPFITAEDINKHDIDFVIIGGGTAGLCLAARLTEDPSIYVLVLEAGEANLDDSAISRPGQYGSHFFNPSYAWNHKTTPQKHSDDNVFIWPRGKGLGGSSAINFMCWTKPPAEDIDDWETLGNKGWNWETYQKYALKAENFSRPTPKSQAIHGLDFDKWKSGTDGPIHTAHPTTITPTERSVFKVLNDMGIPSAPEPLSGDPHGVFFAPHTVDQASHTRSYSTTAYYLPNANRPNFQVLLSAHVSKIITDSTGQLLAAKGVEFSHSGQTYIANARKEVILSAGALKSPQILELSGIGRKDVLENLNIPVNLELPGVGENVQEHYFGGVTWELDDDVEGDTFDLVRDPEAVKKHIELQGVGEGVFTMGVTGFTFVPLQSLSPRANEIHQAAEEQISKNSQNYPPGRLDQYKVQLERLARQAPSCELIAFPGCMSHPNPPTPDKKYLTIITSMNHNFSRGTIHSVSSDAAVDPAFDPHYFEEDTDLQTFVEAFKFVKKLPEQPSFKNLLGKPLVELNPGPDVVTDAEIAGYLKKYMGTTFHTAGSLSMLPREMQGVVDVKLKVYGTRNIRVVDLSIMPLHIASHPQSSVYAIAEYAADIIKGDHKL